MNRNNETNTGHENIARSSTSLVRAEEAVRKVLQYVETQPTLDDRNDVIPLRDDVLEQSLLSMKSRIHSDRGDVSVLALEDMVSTTNSERSVLDDTALKASHILMEMKFGNSRVCFNHHSGERGQCV